MVNNAQVADTPIRLLVVDDHSLFRRGLIALLTHDKRFTVVGEAGDASAAQAAVSRLQPDLVLLDNHMPGVQGIDAIKGLKEAAPGVRVLMLTVSEHAEDMAAGLRHGADGYLLKTIDAEELGNSIVKVWEGDTVVSPEMMGKLVALLRQSPPSSATPTMTVTGKSGGLPLVSTAETSTATVDAESTPSLSPRERDILKLIARGDSNKQIARALDIAETTVKIHVQHILRKLGLANRVLVAVYASERGLG